MIVRAAWVCPIASPPIRDGWVATEQGRIAALGAWPPATSNSCDADVHLPDCVLTPGLVNPHAHLELTCYAGMIAPAAFWQWIGQLLPLRRQPGQLQRERAAVVDGAWRSLRSGVTCVGDISRLNVAWPALKPLPIRKVCFVELLTIADQPPRTLEELRRAVEEVDEDALLTVGVSPHATYSVPMHDAVGAVAYAARIERPWTMHLAELSEEMDFLAGRPHATPEMIRERMARAGVHAPRISAGEYVRRLADVGGPGSIAHGNYLAAEDVPAVASTGVTSIFCPGAHAFFQHPPHPFGLLSAGGARVAIGTDSLASQVRDRLSILDELRHARRATGTRFSAADWLHTGTLAGATALRLDRVIGTLEVGKAADLAAFQISPSSRVETTTEPEALLLDDSAPCDAAWVMVGGQAVDLSKP